MKQKGPHTVVVAHAKKAEKREEKAQGDSRPPLDVTRRIRGTVVSMLMSVPRFFVRGLRVCVHDR